MPRPALGAGPPAFPDSGRTSAPPPPPPDVPRGRPGTPLKPSGEHAGPRPLRDSFLCWAGVKGQVGCGRGAASPCLLNQGRAQRPLPWGGPLLAPVGGGP